MKGIRQTILTAFMLLAIQPSIALAKDWPERHGWVLEAGTNKPIAGAIVIARWQGSASIWPAEAQTRCYHVETATTNDQGEYVVPGWSETASQLLLGDKHVLTDAYKPGYMRSPEYFKQQSYRKNIELLESFKGTSGERLAYLTRLHGATSCGAQNESEKNRLPLLKALYDEARLNGGDKKPVPNEMSLVESIRYDMEILEFGFEEAEKRHLKRP